MEIVYIKNMKLDDFRFISNMSKNEFSGDVMCFVNQRDKDCLVGFLKDGDQFFTIDNVPSVDEQKMEDIIQMTIRFMEYNGEVYVIYKNLVEKYIEYLFFPMRIYNNTSDLLGFDLGDDRGSGGYSY